MQLRQRAWDPVHFRKARSAVVAHAVGVEVEHLQLRQRDWDPTTSARRAVPS